MLNRRAFGSLMIGAGLTAVWAGRAAAYTPGDGLDIVQINRPGEAAVNSYILEGPESLVLLNGQRTGVEAGQVAALARGLAKPVEAIFLSHEHPDHFGGLQVLVDAFPDAPLLASEVTRAALELMAAPTLAFMTTRFGAAMPASVPLPTRIVTHGENLRLAGLNWIVDQRGPCEAGGMTMLYQPDRDILFAAELVGNTVTPWLVDGHTGTWLAELADARTRYANVATCLPGHGAAAPAAALIDGQSTYLSFFRDLVAAEAQAGVLTDDSRVRITAATETRFPGHPLVAPSPDLIAMNADAVASELARQP
jgi:glyoxylase-like metal-dependent hydrolase (beta-lactamase superfamily II)